MPACTALLAPSSLSSWFMTSAASMPLARSFSRYSSIRSGATSKATWFMEPTAVVRSPLAGRPAGEATPGAAGGASGNQKKARLSPLPMSKKKCWPIPNGSSMVLVRGIPRTFE